MPKAFDKSHKITYPPGCKELSEELNKDELLKRLKNLARAFQDMGQDENNQYKQIAVYLATEFFMEHTSKDVRLLVACCVADIFRIFAPDAPYREPGQLKDIFLFLTQQLAGLQDTESPSFKRYFYLLENLAWVKSFNICIELEENQEIFCKLYQLMFQIVNEKHSTKVVSFMLDMMSPVIREADSVSQELLDILLINLIEPHKSQRRCAYNLAKELIKRTDSHIEPYIQAFFNNALMLGKNSDSDLSGRLYDLIHELNAIAPSVLLAVLPQLEFKLKSNDVNDRKAVTRLLSKMFSGPDSDLAMQNKQLWLCYLGRFNDIDITVRRTCVQASLEFIVNQPDLVKDVSEPLKQRQHDPDENVRMDVVQAIVGAARKDFNCITDDLLTCVKERTLDKKFKIRKEALTGLGQIYKRCMQKDESDKTTVERIAWIKNKVLHAYYQNALDDKVLVERILNNSLVPYNLDAEDRMQRLYHLYGTVDEHSKRALNEIFKTQLKLRKLLRGTLELHQRNMKTTDTNMTNRIMAISRGLPDPTKANEYIKKFNEVVHEDTRIRGYLIKLTSPDCTCKKAEECVKEVLKKMGNSIPQNYLYGNVKILMERVAPVMIDATAVVALLKFIEEAVDGVGELCEDIPKPIESGMKLLLMLAQVFPGSFQSELIFNQLMAFVKHDDDTVSDMTMEVFKVVGIKLEQNYPQIFASLLPVLQKMVRIGTPKQAKHAIQCINALCKNKDHIFTQIFEHLQKNMDLDSPYFLSSLVAIGHITQLCPGEFGSTVKGIVSRFIVKELLMRDRGQGRRSTESWCRDDLVSEETNAKLQAMKMMVRWLIGMAATGAAPAALVSTLRLLYTMVLHEGDLMEKGKVNKAEMARLRLQAACCTLKLAQESTFADQITLEQFQTIALVLNDPCYQVRYEFSQKLHKGLLSLKLPLQYMAVFCLAANDPLKERRAQVKQFLQSNITKRREFLKTNHTSGKKVFALLPDYVLPYAIHLLAHDPELQSNEDVTTLKNVRDCLWFIMEPLITKTDNYSYSFYRKLIENIKQTKDTQCPDNEDANKKLYAVCDLALGLVMTKTANFVLKDFPAEPVLPAKMFTQPDQEYSNTKNYLPKELQISQGIQKATPYSAPQAAVKKPAPSGLSPPRCLSASSKSSNINGSGVDSEDEEGAISDASSTSPATKKLPTKASEKNLSFGFSTLVKGSGQPVTTLIKVVKSPPATSSSSSSAAASTQQKGRSTTKTDERPATSKTPSKEASKEDRPPSASAVRGRGSLPSAAAKKGQGKITDFVSPRQALATKNNKSAQRESSSTRTSSKDSPKSSPESETEPKRRGRKPSQASLTSSTIVRGKRKAESDAPGDGSAFKKGKTSSSTSSSTINVSSVSNKSGSRSGRPVTTNKADRHKHSRAADSSPSSRRVASSSSSTESPQKRRPGRPRKESGDTDVVPSSTPSSKSSSTVSSPVNKKKVLTIKSSSGSSSSGSKKNYPIRSNLRRPGSVQNGTSDGEDGVTESSQSQSSQQKVTRAGRTVKPTEAITAKEEEELNVKRRKMLKKQARR